MTILRWTFGALAILGTPVAFVAWLPLLFPFALIGELTSGRIPEFADLLAAFSLAALAVSGYWIWGSWFVFAASCRFPLLSTRSFMTLSTLHHTGWLVVMLLEFPRVDGSHLGVMCMNVAVSLLILVYGWDEEEMERRRKAIVPRFLRKPGKARKPLFW